MASSHESCEGGEVSKALNGKEQGPEGSERMTDGSGAVLVRRGRQQPHRSALAVGEVRGQPESGANRCCGA